MGVAVTRSPILKSICSTPCFLHPASGSPATSASVTRHNEGSAGLLSMINPQSSGNRGGRQIERLAMAVALLVLLAGAAVLAPAFQSAHPLTGRPITTA